MLGVRQLVCMQLIQVVQCWTLAKIIGLLNYAISMLRTLEVL